MQGAVRGLLSPPPGTGAAGTQAVASSSVGTDIWAGTAAAPTYRALFPATVLLQFQDKVYVSLA